MAAFPLENARVEVEQSFFEAVEEGVAATKDDLIKAGRVSSEEAAEMSEGMRREFVEDLQGVLQTALRRYEVLGEGDQIG